MIKELSFAAALSLASLPGVAASFNAADTVSVRDAADLLNGLSTISGGYICGEDFSVQQPAGAGNAIPMKQPRYCQYDLDGGTIMKLTRNINALRAIIQIATDAQQKVIAGYSADPLTPITTVQQVPPDKQVEVNARLQKLLDEPSPFIGETFTYAEFKLGKPNKISPNDLSRISRLIKEDEAKKDEPKK